MADAIVSHCDYYVYALFRENEVPFYIGMGRGERWLEHEKEAGRKNSPKNKVILKLKRLGMEVGKAKLAENLTRREAHDLETVMIGLVGRRPIGPLTNLNAGGSGGADPSPEVRAKLVAAANLRNAELIRRNKSRVWTAEMRAKASAATKRLMTEERRAALSASKLTPAGREKLRAAAKKRMNLSEYGEIISEANRKRVWTEQSRRLVGDQLAERNRARKWTADAKSKISQANRNRKWSEEAKAKASASHRTLCALRKRDALGRLVKEDAP